MDAIGIQSILNPVQEEILKNSFDSRKSCKLFEQETRTKRAIRWFFGFDSIHYGSESFPKRILRKLFHCLEPRAIEITRFFIECFDDLEQDPVKFGGQKNRYDFKLWMETAEKVANWAKESKNKKLQAFGIRLQAKQIGMKYRIEKENGGLDKVSIDQIDQKVSKDLLRQAETWNHAQFNSEWDYITDPQKQKINEVCQYVEFAAFIRDNQILREEFFKWIIRDNNDVTTFVEFSGTMDWMGSIVTKRFHGTSKFEIMHRQNGFAFSEKILTLPFEGVPLSVLDRNQIITLKNDWQLSLANIVKEVQKKKFVEGDINFYSARGLGFTNYNIHKLGSFNPQRSVWNDKKKRWGKKEYDVIDVTQKDWYKKVPVAVEYTEDEFRAKFHKDADIEQDKERGYTAALASRDSETLDIFGTHGWYGAFYVDSETKTYVPLHTGKFAVYYPIGVLALLGFIGNTYNAVFAIQDDNHNYSMRQSTCHVTRLTKEATSLRLKKMANKIEKARKGNAVFQIGGEGCSGFSEKTYRKDRKEVGLEGELNMYQCDVIDCRPKNPLLGGMRKIVGATPKWFRIAAFHMVMYPFIPWRGITVETKKGGKVFHCLTKTQVWRDMKMSLPAMLHEQQTEQMAKYAKGEVEWKDANHLNHWDETLLQKGKFPGFLQRVYDREKKAQQV